MELSTVIGKQILSPNGESLGYAKGVYLNRDLTKVSAYSCIDEEEEEFFLPARAILAVGDALIAGSARIGAPTGIPSPVGKTVYTHLGEQIGIVSDVVTEEETAAVIVCGTTDRTAYPAELTAVAESVIVYPDECTKKALAPKKRRAPAKNKPAERPSSNTESARAPEQTAPAPSPESSCCRFGILGKQVKKSVYDSQGFPIVNAGEKVTAETVLRARKNNRLLELTVNTLTNVW